MSSKDFNDLNIVVMVNKLDCYVIIFTDPSARAEYDTRSIS